jgi:hypothetical protein
MIIEKLAGFCGAQFARCSVKQADTKAFFELFDTIGRDGGRQPHVTASRCDGSKLDHTAKNLDTLYIGHDVLPFDVDSMA